MSRPASLILFTNLLRDSPCPSRISFNFNPDSSDHEIASTISTGIITAFFFFTTSTSQKNYCCYRLFYHL
ncbi:MAG: hypothetical protein ACKO90_41800 [Microcystis panniformis]